MGAAAAAGGFAMALLIAFIGFIIFIGLWIWRKKHLRKHHSPSKIGLFLLNSLMVVTISPFVMLVWAFILVKIENIAIKKSQMKAMEERYRKLEKPLSFGEIIIPQDSWINRGSTIDYPLESFTDIRQGLASVRFSETINMINMPVAALEMTSRGIILEMAEAANYQMDGTTQRCPKGWVLRVLYPEGYDKNRQYQDPSGDWFTPSQWQIDRCFQTTNAVMVIGINQYGVHVLDYTPRDLNNE